MGIANPYYGGNFDSDTWERCEECNNILTGEKHCLEGRYVCGKCCEKYQKVKPEVSRREQFERVEKERQEKENMEREKNNLEKEIFEQSYYQSELYNDYDYDIDHEIIHDSNSHQLGLKKFFIIIIISIIVIIFFVNIMKSCPVETTPNTSPLPRAEYVLPKTEGGSITVKSDILTSHFGISYQQRQRSNWFMKDAYEYRYNGNGTWTITKMSAVNNSSNNTNKNYIDTNSKDEVENYLHGLGF